jgi:glycolate oxidase iron-sulfur subunit
VSGGPVRRPPDRAALDGLLRQCVSCGLCLPHCATYLASGNETLSPRGRLQLLGEVVAGRLPAREPEVVRAFDLCLGCLACAAVCPSGVQAELIDHLRDRGTAATRRSFDALALLDRAPVLRRLAVLAGVVRRACARFLGPAWRSRLAAAPRPAARLGRLLGTLPSAPASDRELVALLDGLVAAAGAGAPGPAARSGGGSEPASGADDAPASALRVAWFAGCADAALLPGSTARLQGLLRACGCAIGEPAGQVCCGAQAAHAARPRRADRLRARNLAAFAADLDGPRRCDHVVVAAAGCGLELRSYPEAFAGRLIDASVLLDRVLLSPLGMVPLRVALHDPCHGRHGQGLGAAPRRLLRRVPGLVLLEPDEVEVCCGGAGIYGLRHPELAERMGHRKAAALAATGCHLVVTTNPGCLGQIADGLALAAPGVPILPLWDLLWYAWSRKPA